MGIKLKRAGAALLSLVFVMSAAAQAIPLTAAAAEGDVAVNTKSPGVPLLNAANYESSQVKDDFLYKTNGLLNPGYKFWLGQTNNLSSMPPSDLASAFSHKFTKQNDDSWWYASYVWQYVTDYSAPGFNDLINKGDITYEMSGKLSYDSHTNFFNHWLRRNDRATLTMYMKTYTAAIRFMKILQRSIRRLPTLPETHLRTGVNSNIDITRITFETIEITSDMVPEDDGNPIGVKTLTLPPNTADLCGNEFASAEITVTAPARQQEWLDTVAPSISAMGIIPEESYYGSDETNTVSGFCLPVQITDNRYADDIISAANADKYVSGANGVGDSSQAQESGKIILKDASDEKDGALYEYCVTSSQDVPSSENWAKARTGEELPFVQLENGNFIHIRLAEDSDRPVFEPVLTVKGYDYAGNFVEYKAEFNAPLYEKIAPTSEAELRYSADLNVAEAVGTAAAEDVGGIEELKYKAVVIDTEQGSVEKPQTPAPEEAQADSSWQTVDTGDGRQTKIEFDVDGVILEAGKNNFLYFYIYTMDRSGNISVTVDEFNFNLLLPSFEISVPQGISDGKVSVSKLNKDDAKELGWTAATVRNIDAYGSINDNYIRTYGALYVALRDTRYNNKIGMFIDDLTDVNSALSVPSSAFEPVSKAPFENLEITDLLSQLAVSEDVPVYIDADVPMGYFDGAMTWDGWGLNFDSLDLVSSIGSTTNFVVNDYEMDSPDYIEGYKEKVRNTAESFSNYYGEVEMYTLVLDSVFTSQQNHDTPDDPVNAAKSWVQFLQTPESERSLAGRVTGEWGNPVKPAMVQKYVVKTARDDGDLSNPINTASMTSLRDASGHAISPSDPRLYEGGGLYDGTEPIRFKSLNGIQLAFSISNNRMPEWGVGDIDFEDSFVRIYKDGVSDPVYEKQLAADASEQLLVFPDIEYESGMYYTEVALQAKISGRVDTVRFETNFYVDATEPDAGAAFKKLSVFLPEIGTHEVFNGIESGEELESVVVPKDGIYQMVQFVSESYGQKGMFDVWLSGSDESPLIINSNIIGFANDGSEAHIVYADNEYVYPTVFVSDDEPTILYIRERLVNGETGPVKQLNLSVSEYAPELEVEVVPDGVSQSVGLRAKKSSSMNGSLKDFYMLQNGMPYDVEVTEEGLLSIDGKTEFNEPQTMSFLLVDEYGIYSYYPDAVDLSEYLDNDAPTLSSRILSSTNDGYEVEINLNDAMVRSSGDNLKLYLSPTDPAAGDGSPGNAADADSDILAITWSEGDELEFGSSPNSAGIYGIAPAEGADSIYVSDDGHSFKAVISGKVPETGVIIAYAVDEAGNKSAPYNILEGIDAKYAAPKITGMSRADDGSLELEFSSGVKIVSPAGANADMTYSDVKTGIPIYSDGVYDITFEDIFGEEHTQTIEVALDGDLKLNVEMTPQTRTNQNVMFNISSAREDELLTITGCTLEEGTIGYDIAEDGQSAQITATENCVFRITLSYGGNEYERTFTVDNIDRSAEAAVTWEYEKDVTGTETLGSVTAIVYPLDYDDELTGTNGALTHTFTSGSIGDTYTFEYTDQAGNSGSVTAELPVDIIIPEPVRLSYTMELFGSTNSLTMPMGTYIYDEEEPFDFGKLTDSQRDVISIDTNVDAKMLILPAGTSAEDVTDDTQSAAIEGAALSGNTVTVTENTEFVIALIASDTVENYDENAPRVIIIPVKLSNIRTLGEVGLVYENLNRYTRRVYLDPKGQEITITNSSGIGIEEEHSQYKGYHYHDFTSNGSFVFYYKDAVGNTGSITAMVNDIIDGNIAPENPEKPVRWWPYKVLDAEGEDQSELSEEPVNYDVTAQIRFNMNVSDAKLYYKTEDGGVSLVESEKAKLNVSSQTVDITYPGNIGETVLEVTGENGTEYAQPIQAVSIIDKTAPEITHDYTAGTPRMSVDITFTSNEEVVCMQLPSEERFAPGEPMTVTVSENGVHEYTFADAAGNVTAVSVEVTDIDTAAPVLAFKLSENGAEYSSWAELAEQNDVAELDSVFFKSNEAGKYTFQQLEGSIAADAWTKLSINRDGVYPLSVWDTAGNMTFTGLSGILVPDNTPPVLWITPQRISVNQGISDAELEAALKDGALVSDDISETDKITLTWDTSELNVNAAGEYTVIYTAADEAGNEAKAERTVRVVGSDELTLSVNGSETTYMGTLNLDTNELTFSVENLIGQNGVYEPYVLYIKKGFKTAGQMKNGSTKVTDGSITVTGSGFYTVYIMSQNRRQYITYLYIEQ